jgi:hypothetical protein
MGFIDDQKPRGWLRFLIIVLMWLTPLFGAARTLGEIEQTEELYPQLVGLEMWYQYKIVCWSFFAVQASLLFIAGYRLDKVYEPSSPRFAIGMLWFAGPILTFMSIVVMGEVANVDLTAGPEGASVMGSVVAGAFWTTVWSLYLWRSGQVRQLYYGDAVGAEVDQAERGWQTWSRERRQKVFFALAWIIAILVYALLFDARYEGAFADGYDRDWEKIGTWALVPPVATLGGLWLYRRFVEGPVSQ